MPAYREPATPTHRLALGAPDMVDEKRQQELDEMVRSDARAHAGRDGGSPAAARRSLGTELRDLRKSTGLTLSDVAKRVQRSTATMSRLERGTSPDPREIEINALLDVYEAQTPGLISDRRRTALLTLVTRSRADDWFNEYRDVWGVGPSPGLRRYIELETDADGLATYESNLVPGLLQTDAYARAMAETYRPDETDALKERFVRFRMERQERFAGRPQHFVIAEAALRRDPGHGNDMHKQLDVLATEIEKGRDNVRIQIAPTSLAIPAATGGPFLLFRFGGDTADVVYLEHRAGSLFLDSAADVARYEEEFAELTASSLTTRKSLDLVREVMAELRP